MGAKAQKFPIEKKSASAGLASRPPYARMLKIHQHLAAGGYPNCSAMSQEFEVSAKTVQRDIDFMRDQMLLPIEYDRIRHGFYYSGPVSAFPMVNVTQGELVALLVAQKAVEQHRGTIFERPLRSAFEKLSSNMKEEFSFSLDQLSDAFSFRSSGAAVGEMKVFQALADAALKSEVVEFDYLSLQGKKPERRRMEPYHLGCIGNQWYLIGNDQIRGEMRTFALTRLENVKNLKQTFIRPPDFSVSQMMAGSFSAFEAGRTERVRILMDDIGARLASERIWHKSQKMLPLAQGGAELSLEVGLAPDLENWILSWGDHAEVLEPASLRSRIRDRIRTMSLKY